MSKKIVYFRADGNDIIATGHVMRCLSIADQVRKLGAQAIFLLADSSPCDMILNRGYEAHVLGTTWDNLDAETEVLCEYIKENDIKRLVVDSYYATEMYLQKLSEYTDVMYIDDLRSGTYNVKSLVHYWAFADKDDYKKTYESLSRMPDCLVGSSYIPLREEFTYQPYKVNDTVNNILITTGGTDILDVTGRLLGAVVNNSMLCDINYHVIVGCFNRNKDKLYSLSREHPNIILHENVSNMSEWMRMCDAAVTAAGTTIYELCACGVPSVCLEIAENQNGAVIWENEGYMLYAGNAYMDIDNCIERCEEALVRYCTDYDMRKKYSDRMQTLVDGCGALRIAEYLVFGGEKNVK